MPRLSDYFSSHEFACKGAECCGGSYPMDEKLIDALEEFPSRVGGAIRINNGFRCLRHNRDVGSNDSSQHPRGRAADIGRLTVLPSRKYSLLSKALMLSPMAE